MAQIAFAAVLSAYLKNKILAVLPGEATSFLRQSSFFKDMFGLENAPEGYLYVIDREFGHLLAQYGEMVSWNPVGNAMWLLTGTYTPGEADAAKNVFFDLVHGIGRHGNHLTSISSNDVWKCYVQPIKGAPNAEVGIVEILPMEDKAVVKFLDDIGNVSSSVSWQYTDESLARLTGSTSKNATEADWVDYARYWLKRSLLNFIYPNVSTEV